MSDTNWGKLMNETRMDRRKFLKGVGGVAGLLVVPGLVAACGGQENGDPSATASAVSSIPSPTSSEVIVPTWGGSFADAQKEIFYDPFTATYDVRVVTPGADPTLFEEMMKSGKVTWDTMDTDGYAGVAWQRDDLLVSAPDWVPRTDQVPEDFRDYFVWGYSYNIMLGYLKESFPDGGPQNWSDFWDVERFPGVRSYPSFYPGCLEPALVADGVPKDALYPVDIDRALAKLDEIKPNLRFAPSYGDAATAIANKSVAMGVTTAARLNALKDDGVDVEMVWGAAVLFPWSCYPVPKGAPHEDAMWALLAFIVSDPERLGAFMATTGYGQTNREAYDYVTDAALERLVDSDEHRELAIVLDEVAFADQFNAYGTAYTKWLSA